MSAAHWQNSIAKSRSDTESTEFGVGPPPNFRSAASRSRSPGPKKGWPASAPEPSGHRSDRSKTPSSRSKSRVHAHAWLSVQWLKRMGWARWRCV